MAMHFSDEEKQKIMDEDMELYKKRDQKTNEEDIKNLKGIKKAAYYWQYYVGSAVGAIIAIAVIAMLVHNSFSKTASCELYVAIENDAISDEAVESFEDKLEKLLGLDGENEYVNVDVYSTDQQLQTFLYVGKVDVVICSEDNFVEWAHGGYFYEPQANEEVEFFNDYPEDKKFYSTYITGEDVRESENLQDVQAGDDTKYNFGLYLNDSKAYKDELEGFVENPVIGVSAATKNPDYAQRFVEYMMK